VLQFRATVSSSSTSSSDLLAFPTRRSSDLGEICGPRIGSLNSIRGSNKWTMFDLPVHGTEIRHISLLERDGKLQIIVPVYRSSQMGVMIVRSEAELKALEAQAK